MDCELELALQARKCDIFLLHIQSQLLKLGSELVQVLVLRLLDKHIAAALNSSLSLLVSELELLDLHLQSHGHLLPHGLFLKFDALSLLLYEIDSSLVDSLPTLDEFLLCLDAPLHHKL